MRGKRLAVIKGPLLRSVRSEVISITSCTGTVVGRGRGRPLGARAKGPFSRRRSRPGPPRLTLSPSPRRRVAAGEEGFRSVSTLCRRGRSGRRFVPS